MSSHTHTYTRTMPETLFPLKINGPSNAANAIAAKFGAPAGTMRRDFHVVSANNWICPQFGSDEARFLLTPAPSPTNVLPSPSLPSPFYCSVHKLNLCFSLASFSLPFLFSSHPLSQFFSSTYKMHPSSLANWDLHTHTQAYIALRLEKSIVT